MNYCFTAFRQEPYEKLSVVKGKKEISVRGLPFRAVYKGKNHSFGVLADLRKYPNFADRKEAKNYVLLLFKKKNFHKSFICNPKKWEPDRSVGSHFYF